ncbi:MAG: BrnT family toxin [Myxococcaceae bacterium]
MEFAWDPAKNIKNLEKHGVAFEEAITAFDDPFALIAPDLKHSTAEEERDWLLGESDTGVLVVIFTIRKPGPVFRIISARPASRKERKYYVENRRISI